jgi:hypothetical protein
MGQMFGRGSSCFVFSQVVLRPNPIVRLPILRTLGKDTNCNGVRRFLLLVVLVSSLLFLCPNANRHSRVVERNGENNDKLSNFFSTSVYPKGVKGCNLVCHYPAMPISKVVMYYAR